MSGLWHSFREGGWAMYPIFAFGFLGVGAAGRFAWRGEHQLVGFVRWITTTILACGAFGFFIGFQRMLGFAGANSGHFRLSTASTGDPAFYASGADIAVWKRAAPADLDASTTWRSRPPQGRQQRHHTC
jgi:hypothetical protein